MPVKKRAGKLRNVKITDDAVELFRIACANRDTYHSCIRGERCHKTEVGRHCDACRAYLDASRDLGTALELRPWEPTPEWCDTDEPPDWAGKDTARRTEWAKVRELRLALDEAVGGRV